MYGRNGVRSVLALGTGLVLALAECDSPTGVDPELQLSGTVREVGTGLPVATAQVTLWGSATPPDGPGTEFLGRALTDAQGRYLLAIPLPAPSLCPYLNMWATKHGYGVSSWNNFANPALDPIRCTGGKQTLDFEILPLP